jgi:hypothetical protein
LELVEINGMMASYHGIVGEGVKEYHTGLEIMVIRPRDVRVLYVSYYPKSPYSIAGEG